MTDFYLNERIMEHRVAEAHRQAESERLKSEFAAAHPNWLVRQRNGFLSWLGRCLVSSGRQLLQAASQYTRR